MRKPTASKPVVRATILPTTRGVRLFIKYVLSADFTASLAITPSMIGIETRKLNSAALAALSPIRRPAMIVLPDRDVPGTSAITCASPMMNARERGNSASGVILLRCGSLSTIINRTPTMVSVAATTHGLLKNGDVSIKSAAMKPTSPAGSIAMMIFTANR